MQAINFNRGFQLGAKQGHRWVKDLPSIRKNYIKGWFTVDLLSIMPWWIPPLITQGEGDTDLMRAVRAVRLLRLLKLSRVLRLSSVIKRYEMRMDVTYATISLCDSWLKSPAALPWVRSAPHQPAWGLPGPRSIWSILQRSPNSFEGSRRPQRPPSGRR